MGLSSLKRLQFAARRDREKGHSSFRHTCAVEDSEDGRRAYVLEDGLGFASLSAAGSAVMGGVACNGWRFWSVEGAEPAKRASRQTIEEVD